uniref:Si:dkey-19b23.7 n=1 Tax=Electrophorus electricus TaxID=8005 RepID=A0A4W4DPP8_ELEEL
YFQPWLRGKEELLLTVVNEDLVGFYLFLSFVEMNCTLFLLAGYAKYGRPYAWIRSNHDCYSATDGHCILLCILLTGTRVWDIVNELVGLCTMPPPDNPFSLDMCYLQTLPLPKRFLVTGALLNFLEMIVNILIFSSFILVVEEIEPLRRMHFQSFTEVQKLRGMQSGSPTLLDER